eukprot:CAMPEP_0114494208 /NCGR_PEP_ID=MMETSP0109-20121206/4527_1 /TAXON_ID=29199 /ORGANISM="Chlorarachnion reptans, Strain CCCM449" /LENGTH=167 /DNA_ID=CAMNT_0001671225 /DNA_START=320 /DNA_END=823 /DNA_ORIENTATION=+
MNTTVTDSVSSTLTGISVPVYAGLKAIDQNQESGSEDYYWVAFSFVALVLIGAGALVIKYLRIRKRKKTIEQELRDKTHKNYNTFNSLKHALDPEDLNEAMEGGAITEYTLKSPSMRQVKSCPNLRKQGQRDKELFTLGQRRYSGSYLNMLRLDPISEDTDAESYEA